MGGCRCAAPTRGRSTETCPIPGAGACKTCPTSWAGVKLPWRPAGARCRHCPRMPRRKGCGAVGRMKAEGGGRRETSRYFPSVLHFPHENMRLLHPPPFSRQILRFSVSTAASGAASRVRSVGLQRRLHQTERIRDRASWEHAAIRPRTSPIISAPGPTRCISHAQQANASAVGPCCWVHLVRKTIKACAQPVAQTCWRTPKATRTIPGCCRSGCMKIRKSRS